MALIMKLNTSLGGGQVLVFIFVTSILFAVSEFSNFLSSHEDVKQSDFKRAILDNLTHGIVAVISMYAFLTLTSTKKYLNYCVRLLYSILCGVVACIIDIDHFIAAGSVRLKNATSLSRRPSLHCTTVLVIPGIVLIAISATRIQSKWLHRMGWILIIAVVTHHMRDAIRRGLWICPLTTTPAITPSLYGFLLVTTPVLFFLVDGIVFNTSYKWSNLPQDIATLQYKITPTSI